VFEDVDDESDFVIERDCSTGWDNARSTRAGRRDVLVLSADEEGGGDGFIIGLRLCSEGRVGNG
jgi:hypothetical protein